jgi:glycosyltransferase involved in cell wall biosynthesis
MPDVLIVGLGTTAGLRTAEDELAASLERAGASVALVRAAPAPEVRTFVLTDLVQARAARRAALDAPDARAVLYAQTTAALLWPRPGAIRFDATAAGNRPGRHGLWQRPVERARLRAAPLLVPWSEGALAEAGRPATPAVVVPVPAEPSGPPAPERDIAAITYAANPSKKGLDRVLEAWARARRAGETLVVGGLAKPSPSGSLARLADVPGVEWRGSLPATEYRALVRRARVFVTAPRREDYGIAQLEALADGCALVTTPAPGPYAALPLARELDARLVTDDLAAALRAALDEPVPDYAARAAQLLAPYRRAAVDDVVARELLPRLLA